MVNTWINRTLVRCRSASLKTFALIGPPILVGLAGLSVATSASAQRPSDDGWEEGVRAPPPAQSIERMRKSIRVGKDRGHTVIIKGVEITDPRFNPFLLQITVSGEKSLGIYKARFSTEYGNFETELPQETNARWKFGLGNAPTGPDAPMSLEQNEERTFNISIADAKVLMAATSVDLTITGRLQERNFTIKPKQLAVLQEWLGPRIEKHSKEKD